MPMVPYGILTGEHYKVAVMTIADIINNARNLQRNHR